MKRKNGNAPVIHQRNIDWFNKVCPQATKDRVCAKSDGILVVFGTPLLLTEVAESCQLVYVSWDNNWYDRWMHELYYKNDPTY